MLCFEEKPVIAMLHLKGSDANDRLERMKRETDLYLRCGVDAVLVENYFGHTDDCARALEYLQKHLPDVCYGVNILGDDHMTFALAKKYNADFVQIDSVSGHLTPAADETLGRELSAMRKGVNFDVLGGVRFKYQPVRSGRTLQEDMEIGKSRCDAIVTTGDGTGRDCPTEKLAEFKKILRSFPLVVGAGVTADNVSEKLKYADAVIIGSWLKDKHQAANEVSPENVIELMDVVWDYRMSHLKRRFSSTLYRMAAHGWSEGRSGFHAPSYDKSIPFPFRFFGWGGIAPVNGIAFRIERSCFETENPLLFFEADVNFEIWDTKDGKQAFLDAVFDHSSGVTDLRIVSCRKRRGTLYSRMEFRLSEDAIRYEPLHFQNMDVNPWILGGYVIQIPVCGEFECTFGEATAQGDVFLHTDSFCMK